MASNYPNQPTQGGIQPTFAQVPQYATAVPAPAPQQKKGGFLSSIGQSLSTVANTISQKSKETYQHLKAPPTSVQCTRCNNPVMIPPVLFTWSCPRCTTINSYDHRCCVTCECAKPNIVPTVTCTMCNTVNNVPTSNAEKQWGETKKSTVSFVQKASEKIKSEFANLKSVPPSFNCEHCNTLLGNPNLPQQYLQQQPLQVQGAPTISVPQSQPIPGPQYTEGNSYPKPPQYQADYSAVASSSSSSGSSASPRYDPTQSAPITRVICSVCRKETSVPGSMFAHKMRGAANTVTKGATQAYYTVADKKFANCPICQHPNKLPTPTASAPVNNNAPMYSNGPSAQPVTMGPVQVDVLCEKCNSHFPAVSKP